MASDRSAHLSFRLAPDALDGARDLAAQRHITLTELIRQTLEAEIQAERASAEHIRQPVASRYVAGHLVRFYRSPLSNGPALAWVDCDQLLQACGIAEDAREAGLKETLQMYPANARSVRTVDGMRVLTSTVWTCVILRQLMMVGVIPAEIGDDAKAGFFAGMDALVDGMRFDEGQQYLDQAYAREVGEAAP